MSDNEMKMQIVLEALNNTTAVFNEIRNQVNEFVDSVNGVVAPINDVSNQMMDMAETAQYSFDDAASAAMEAADAIDGVDGSAFDDAAGAADSASEAIDGITGDAFDAAAEAANSASDAIDSITSSSMDDAANAADAASQSLDGMSTAADAVKGVVDSGAKNMSLAIEAITVPITEVKSDIKAIGETAALSFDEAATATNPLQAKLLTLQEDTRVLIAEIKDMAVDWGTVSGESAMGAAGTSATVAGGGKKSGGAVVEEGSKAGFFEKMSGAANTLNEHFSKLKTTAMNFAMGATVGFGLFELADKAIEAGNNLYVLSTKMHISATEAGELNRMLKLTDTDAKPFISTMLKLDKAVETAGAKGNATTKAMAEWGIKLTDAHGKLLPVNDQLEALANAYKKAADAGNEQAMVADVLGPRGQSLTMILADYAEAAEVAAQVHSIGIDPDEAHKAEVSMRALKIEMGQVGTVVSMALMPVAMQVMPIFMDALKGIADFVKSHKEDIRQFTDGLINMGKQVLSVVGPPIKDVFGWLSEHGEIVKAVLIGIAAGFTALKAAAAIDGIIKTFKSFTTVAGALTTSGIVGLVIVGIAALAAAAYLIIKNWGPISAFFKKLWDDVTGWFVTAWDNIKKFFSGIWDWIKGFFVQWGPVILTMIAPFLGIPLLIFQHWDQIKTFLKAVWDGVISIAKGFVDGIVKAFEWMYNHNYYFKDLVDFIVNAFNTVKTFVTQIWNDITGFLKKAWEGIAKIATGFWNDEIAGWKKIFDFVCGIVKAIWDAVVAAWKGMVEAVAPVFTQLWDSVTDIFNKIKNFIGDIIKDAFDWGKNLIGGFIDGIKSMISAVGDAVSNVVNKVKGFLGFHSPAKEGPGSDADTWAPNLMNMFAGGILDNIDNVVAAARRAAEPIRQAMASIFPSSSLSASFTGCLAGTSMVASAGGYGGSQIINYIYCSGNVTENERKLAETVSDAIWQKINSSGKH